ncbi:MAG: Ig-like domain-containing protein [Oscillospiraceae bacterium]|nr:Ig-like domain-containing protein [Oscillospiraceae bacterium]
MEIYYLGKPIKWEDANHVKDVSGNRGQKYTFTLNIKPSGIDATAVWTSSDESIATVDQNGVVSALKVGKCNITATVDGISHTIIFRVVEPKN